MLISHYFTCLASPKGLHIATDMPDCGVLAKVNTFLYYDSFVPLKAILGK